MCDQADGLRNLALDAAAKGLMSDLPRPRLVVVSGSQKGVGATSVSVNLAVALVQQGHRTVLIDANMRQPDATALCQMKEVETLGDVLSGRRTVSEVVRPGPAGLRVLPGIWDPAAMMHCSAQAQNRLVTGLLWLSRQTDVMVLDGGSDINQVALRFWRVADLVLLTMTTDPVSIMNAYAAIKMAVDADSWPRIGTLVNRQPPHGSRDNIHNRIADACQRFLNRSIESCGGVPNDSRVAEAARLERPFVLCAPYSLAAVATQALAQNIGNSLITPPAVLTEALSDVGDRHVVA